MKNVGYWVDLASVNFADTSTLKWVQALPLGTYSHPLHGKINVTPDRVARFADSVKKNVREITLDVNYDHREHTGKAAGWIRDAEDRGPAGLWIAVEFTEPAQDAIKKGEYRYMSSEFSDSWEHPKSGVKTQDVLFGAALTNRPWLKDILPINMSEVDGGEQVDEFLKKLREQYKLSEDATEDEILAAAAAATEEPKKKEEESDPPKEEETSEVSLSEEDRKLLKTLGENNPALARLTQVVEAQHAQIRTLGEDLTKQKAATMLSEANARVTTWTKGGKKGKFALPPSATEGLPVLLAEMPTQFTVKFSEFIDSILETGLVELGERGKPTVMEDGKTATQQFTELAEKLMSETQGMTYADAVSRISEQNEGLWEAYRQESLEEV